MIAYIFLADGFEETEAVAPLDLLRRAGVNAFTVSAYDVPRAVGAHGIIVNTDMTLDPSRLKDADLLVCPGGMPGAANLADNKVIGEMLKRQHAEGKFVAAICAAPAVTLAPLGILKGKNATCYPGFQDMLAEHGANHQAERVVRDGNVITANGPSSALRFGLALVDALCGPEKTEEVAAGILM